MPQYIVSVSSAVRVSARTKVEATDYVATLIGRLRSLDVEAKLDILADDSLDKKTKKAALAQWDQNREAMMQFLGNLRTEAH